MIKLDTSGRVRTIVLARPEQRNAINPELCAALLAGLRSAMADDAVGAIVLAGEGPIFCAGLDLKFARTATPAATAKLVADQQDVARAILYGPKPVVAAVHGHAVGGGVETALACDIVIWGEGAEGWFPEVEKGLVVTGGTSLLLPRIVGLARAKAMVLLGERWSGAALAASGLVHKVVAADEVRVVAMNVAERLARQPAGALAFAKRMLARDSNASVEAALGLEAKAAIEGPAAVDPARD